MKEDSSASADEMAGCSEETRGAITEPRRDGEGGSLLTAPNSLAFTRYAGSLAKAAWVRFSMLTTSN